MTDILGKQMQVGQCQVWLILLYGHKQVESALLVREACTGIRAWAPENLQVGMVTLSSSFDYKKVRKIATHMNR